MQESRRGMAPILPPIEDTGAMFYQGALLCTGWPPWMTPQLWHLAHCLGLHHRTPEHMPLVVQQDCWLPTRGPPSTGLIWTTSCASCSLYGSGNLSDSLWEPWQLIFVCVGPLVVIRARSKGQIEGGDGRPGCSSPRSYEAGSSFVEDPSRPSVEMGVDRGWQSSVPSRQGGTPDHKPLCGGNTCLKQERPSTVMITEGGDNINGEAVPMAAPCLNPASSPIAIPKHKGNGAAYVTSSSSPVLHHDLQCWVRHAYRVYLSQQDRLAAFRSNPGLLHLLPLHNHTPDLWFTANQSSADVSPHPDVSLAKQQPPRSIGKDRTTAILPCCGVPPSEQFEVSDPASSSSPETSSTGLRTRSLPGHPWARWRVTPEKVSQGRGRSRTPSPMKVRGMVAPLMRLPCLYPQAMDQDQGTLPADTTAGYPMTGTTAPAVLDRLAPRLSTSPFLRVGSSPCLWGPADSVRPKSPAASSMLTPRPGTSHAGYQPVKCSSLLDTHILVVRFDRGRNVITCYRHPINSMDGSLGILPSARCSNSQLHEHDGGSGGTPPPAVAPSDEDGLWATLFRVVCRLHPRGDDITVGGRQAQPGATNRVVQNQGITIGALERRHREIQGHFEGPYVGLHRNISAKPPDGGLTSGNVGARSYHQVQVVPSDVPEDYLGVSTSLMQAVVTRYSYPDQHVYLCHSATTPRHVILELAEHGHDLCTDVLRLCGADRVPASM